jgi:hypothetical protein
MLLYANDYLPYAAPPKTAASSLARQIAAVYAAGNRVKVAVIHARHDLGAIPSLFGKPRAYARFLGHETPLSGRAKSAATRHRAFVDLNGREPRQVRNT